MKKKIDTNWISFSDIMTGLMVIFLFISISYMLEVKKKQQERDEIFKEFKETKESLFDELNETFKDDFLKWNVELDKDLSIKFTNPDVLFESGKTVIRPYFSEILRSFFPRYFKILLQKKYKEKIAEVRIEGHTDRVPAPEFDKDPYIGNVILSQLRSAEVLKFFRNMDYYSKLSLADEERIQFWLTANGLSYGRTLDINKQLTAISNAEVDNGFSRRVEFRIVTSSDELIKRVLKEMK